MLVSRQFRNQLKESGLRWTRERKELVDLILSLEGHFTLESVLKKMRAGEAKGSRATLYRLIPVLIRAQLIQQSLLTGPEQTLFEVTWNKEHHDHLICSGCGKVVEFQDDRIEKLQSEISKKYDFTLDHHIMELIGRCAACTNLKSS